MSESTPKKGDRLHVGLLFNLLGRTTTVVSGGLVSILLARHFGAETFGQWAVASVYATLVGTFIEGGFGRLLIRDAARDRRAAGRALGTVLKARLGLAAVVVPVALAIAGWSAQSLAAWWLVVLLVGARFVADLVATFANALYAFDRFKVPNMVEAVRRTGMLGATVLIVLIGAGIHWAAVATLVLTVAGSGMVIREAQRFMKLDFSRPVRESAGDALWFWINGVLFWINGEIDQLMLSHISGNTETGIYAAAVRLTALFYIIPRAVNDTIIRRLFRSTKDGRGVNRHVNATVMLLLGLGGVVGASLNAHAQPIVELLYKPAFAASGPVLAWYGVFLAMYFLRVAPAWYLSSSDRVPLMSIYLLVASAANVGANLYLIPRQGALGATYSTLLSEVLLLSLSYLTTLRHNGRRLLYATLLGLLPGALSLGFYRATAGLLHWMLSAAIGGALGLALLGLMALRVHRGWNPLDVLSDDAPSSADTVAPIAEPPPRS